MLVAADRDEKIMNVVRKTYIEIIRISFLTYGKIRKQFEVRVVEIVYVGVPNL